VVNGAAVVGGFLRSEKALFFILIFRLLFFDE
jgi:hypothetical protein